MFVEALDKCFENVCELGVSSASVVHHVFAQSAIVSDHMRFVCVFVRSDFPQRQGQYFFSTLSLRFRSLSPQCISPIREPQNRPVFVTIILIVSPFSLL